MNSRPNLQSVVVLGAGTMGSRIAAHCANHGMTVWLLDLTREQAKGGVEAALKSRPNSFFLPSIARSLKTGSFDQDLERVKQADWVVEAVIENLEVKRQLMARVISLANENCALTTNTSGIPIRAISEGWPEQAQRRWFGTHFFNPPRYLRLVEVIPTAKSDPELVAWVSRTLEGRLGKSIVPCRDTPNFIANRIGTFTLLNTLKLMRELDLSVEEIDALTGPILGWPKSATFRTLDIVGIDTLALVVKNTYENLKNDEARELYRMPSALEEMIRRGWLGEKSGQGFYKKVKGGRGGSEILALDLTTWEYGPQQKPKLEGLTKASALQHSEERLRALVNSEDRAGQFAWRALSDLLLYSAARIPEIADNGAEIDRAMRWGYGWHSGPFEIWDQLGLKPTCDRMLAEGRKLPEYVQQTRAQSETQFYRWTATTEGPAVREISTLPGGAYQPVPRAQLTLAAVKQGRSRVKGNAGCSLLDLGQGVGCLEFHSKMNAIGRDIVELVTQTLSEKLSPFEAFVITNDAENFSAGADLLFLLLAIQNEEWDEIEAAVRAFQGMNLAIKRSARPVVVAPFGLALGGACEMTLHAPAVVAHAELYTGLVEIGVGLIPAGGGTTQMAMRSARNNPVATQEAFKATFETIALAKVSSSALEARQLGYLRESEMVIASRDQLLTSALLRAREMATSGYEAAVSGATQAPGPSVQATLEWGVFLMRQGEYITAFEEKIARHLIGVLCANGAPAGQAISEEYLLDLEREAFLSLCGEASTKERIRHMLETGKALRN